MVTIKEIDTDKGQSLDVEKELPINLSLSVKCAGPLPVTLPTFYRYVI